MAVIHIILMAPYCSLEVFKYQITQIYNSTLINIQHINQCRILTTQIT